MIEKAKAAKSAEELLALAKENNVEMTADEAKTCFAQLNPKSGELDDDELDAVAGGGCGYASDGRRIVDMGGAIVSDPIMNYNLEADKDEKRKKSQCG